MIDFSIVSKIRYFITGKHSSEVSSPEVSSPEVSQSTVSSSPSILAKILQHTNNTQLVTTQQTATQDTPSNIIKHTTEAQQVISYPSVVTPLPPVSFDNGPSEASNTSRSFTVSKVEAVWLAYIGDTSEAMCPLCNENRIIRNDRSTWEMSHIRAVAKGGSNDLDNIRPLCYTCNRTMSVQHLKAYLIERYPERYTTVTKSLKLS